MPILECRVPDLCAALRNLLEQIPRGRVTTYGDLAEALGSLQAARWVGEYLRDHQHTTACLCHRVVRRTGELGLFVTGDAADKERRLKDDTIRVRDGHVDLERYRFREFQTDRPLIALAEFQETLPQVVRLTPFSRTPEFVAGVDVSYEKQRDAVGAYALVESASGRLVWSTTVSTPVTFPYIAGFLAFRELPVLLELLEEVDRQGRRADVLFVDGHGMLHHRRAGIATHFGVVADVRTIGIGKKLLCGRVDVHDMEAHDPRPVIHEGRLVGMAMKAKDSSRPIFVSPGQHIGGEDAVRLTQRLFHGHRLPEPLYHADSLSRRCAAGGEHSA